MTGATASIPIQPEAAPLAAVAGAPRAWLRLEGLAALVAGVVVYLAAGGPWLLLVPLVLLVDVSMAGYVAGPRPGAAVYNLAHSQATAIAVLGGGAIAGVTPLILAGAVLLAHSGMDRLAGYGLKYPTAFRDTHMRIEVTSASSHASTYYIRVSLSATPRNAPLSYLRPCG